MDDKLISEESENIEENAPVQEPENDEDDFEVLDEQMLPPVNEFKRFVKIFFRRKVVVFGAVVVFLVVLIAIFADFVAPFGYNEQNLFNVLQPPNRTYLLGTDALGRCLLSRIIHGSRIALMVGVSTVLVSSAVGTFLGLIAGFFEGFIGHIIMRLADVMLSIPPIVLALIIAAALRMGINGVILALGLSFMPGYIRLINGQVLSVKQNDYVMAARSMGSRGIRTVFKHVLPNCVSPLIVQMTMMMGISILAEAGLSFLGLGISPPTPAWGSLCFDGYRFIMTLPLLSIAPGVAIMLLVFSLNMVGDGLRDALDPKMRGTSSK